MKLQYKSYAAGYDKVNVIGNDVPPNATLNTLGLIVIYN